MEGEIDDEKSENCEVENVGKEWFGLRLGVKMDKWELALKITFYIGIVVWVIFTLVWYVVCNPTKKDDLKILFYGSVCIIGATIGVLLLIDVAKSAHREIMNNPIEFAVSMLCICPVAIVAMIVIEKMKK